MASPDLDSQWDIKNKNIKLAIRHACLNKSFYGLRICVFKIFYFNDRQIGQRTDGKGQLNLVLKEDFYQAGANDTVYQYFDKDVWIFQMVSGNTNEFKTFFSRFTNITLQSKIYSTAEANPEKLFEIYRKSSKSDLTISQFCTFQESSGSINMRGPQDIWLRRKNLEGVHFNIGCILSSSFSKQNSQV